jgi:uncharacterized protein YlaI
MKTLNSPIKFMVYSVLKALRHPRSPIRYYYCSNCKIRFNAKEPACPKCGARVDSSPENRQESPIPWYGCVILIIIGAAIWGWSAACNIGGISELGRILVYLPLGNLFGMSLKRTI